MGLAGTVVFVFVVFVVVCLRIGVNEGGGSEGERSSQVEKWGGGA